MTDEIKESTPISSKTLAEMAASDGPERRTNKRDVGEDRASQLSAIKAILGDVNPIAVNGADLSTDKDQSIDEMMDVTIEGVEAARLKYLSEHDELTGQKNRLKLHEALEEQIVWARKNNLFCSFIIAGIDNLSVINDTFGYQLGDEVISAVALEIAQDLRKHDVIGRYSTNKFGVILPRCGSDALRTTIQRLIERISSAPMKTSKGYIPVTISIGGVVMPQFAGNAQEAISRSLEALDNTKRKSANGYVIYEFSSEREVDRQRNLQIAEEIVSALNEKRMKLSLQKIVSADTGEIAHYECLLVMECENGEVISAGEFLPIAEKLGLCRLIDYRTLELAISLLKQDTDLQLALNVSSLTTSDPNWLIALQANAGSDKAVTKRLMVEITETVLITDLEATAGFVASLRDLGCSVAIDDFGAGYSSYRNLRALDVNVVKIDGEFVRNITNSKDDQIFVASLVALAKSFDMETVAEFVKDEATASLLRDLDVDYLQGYLFGRPEIVGIISDEDAEAEVQPEINAIEN